MLWAPPVVRAAWAAAWAVSSRVGGAASAAPAPGITRGKTRAPATSREQIRSISNSSFLTGQPGSAGPPCGSWEPYTLHTVEGQVDLRLNAVDFGILLSFPMISDGRPGAGARPRRRVPPET